MLNTSVDIGNPKEAKDIEEKEFMMSECFYCEDGEKRKSLMIEICKLDYATVYLNRNQKYPGRCVVKLNEHKTEYFQMTKDQRYGYFEELAATAKAIYDLYHPDKINYATFGDLVPHVHVHVVPKYQGGPDWGLPFDDTQGRVELSDAEYQKMVDELREAIEKNLQP